ncbi:MAG: GTP pyrophosphokinase family protein [Eubacteriaceae bacterium]|nr:GTP pyrophosphokinase family protein [Eubacteriaceae bacterium]
MEYFEEGFDWDSFLVPYSQAVRELALKFNLFKSQCEEQDGYSHIHYVTARLKSVNSIIDKAKRYSIQLNELGLKLNDIAGIRLVTKFEHDVEALAKLIELRTDMRAVVKKDYFSEPKQSGYKAMHIIVEYDVNTVNGFQTVLCEIQLRTIAMDFWASIEHSLKYKYKDEMPESLQSRLVDSANAVMGLDYEMGKIREEIVAAQKMYSQKQLTVARIAAGLKILSNSGNTELYRQYADDFSKSREEDNILQLMLLGKELEKDLRELNIGTGFLV